MPYTGRLYIADLNDRKIRTRWFRNWADARSKYERRDKDRARVEELADLITRQGQRKPVHLGVNYRGEEVTLDDGHHRVFALEQLGIETITFNWYDTRRVLMLDEPFDYGRWGLTNPDA